MVNDGFVEIIKLKVFITTIFLLGFVAQAFGQGETFVFIGKIGDRGLLMILDKNGRELGGTITYDKVINETVVDGVIEENNRFTLTEKLSGRAKVGTFKGVWNYLDFEDRVTLSGTWIDSKETKTIEFYLTDQSHQGAGRIFPNTYSEKNKPKLFEIEAEYPQMSGMVFAEKFSQAAKKRVMTEVAKFRRDLLKQTADEIKNMKEIGISSTVDISYRVVYADNEVISIWFANTYFSGGAHPNSYTFTLNFDLKTGRELKLGDIFEPRSNYLQVLSDYCVKELNDSLYDGREDEWVTNGAGAKLENYDSWNIARKGIIINFDPYQVASYAAGPQEVRVPFENLSHILGKPFKVFEKK